MVKPISQSTARRLRQLSMGLTSAAGQIATSARREAILDLENPITRIAVAANMLNVPFALYANIRMESALNSATRWGSASGCSWIKRQRIFCASGVGTLPSRGSSDSTRYGECALGQHGCSRGEQIQAGRSRHSGLGD